ncbi:MAG TPA: glycosyl hydrolase family 28-related protein [Abditibacteriaceae bacterium]|jgi:hypothetical protein
MIEALPCKLFLQICRTLPLNTLFIAIVCAVLCFGHSLSAAPERNEALRLPALKWEERSDWVNVKTDITPAALGDGVTDDTNSLQKALDGVKDGSTLYLPPGRYRITRMLSLQGPLIGVLLVGHGRDTQLIWDGEIGGKMFTDDGVAYSRFVGMVFNGQNKAAVGFWHYSTRRFETEVRHQHLAFLNFTDAGVLADPKDKFALAETTFENCLFDNCRRGVAFLQFNDYDFTFDGCEFRRNDIAIECTHGNFYVRNCHFENSRTVDIHAYPEHGSSVRRCTSVGSNQFIRFAQPVGTMTIQDCHVDSWKSTDGAITLSGAPVILFDCVFTNPPAGSAAVNIGNGQRLIVSNNVLKGAPSIFQANHKGRLYPVPHGKRKGSIQSARQSFFRSSARIPTKVFDAKRDFGAKGDGKTDDTAALQKTIDEARKIGKGALAYLPSGSYVISKTLHLTGRDYFVGGSGFHTRLIWKGNEGGTMLEVRNPQQVTLEHIAIGNHDSGLMNNGIDIHQTGSPQPSRMTYDGVFVYGMYQLQPFRQGLHFTNLDGDDVVVMPHVQGNLRFTDCAAATILANCTYEGSILVEGKNKSRGGLLGFQTRLATLVTHGLYLKDSQSIVMSDFYVEQANNGFVFEGAPGDSPGRATIQGAKVHFTVDKADPTMGTALSIANYAGQIFFGHNQFYNEPKQLRIRQRGENAVDLFLLANSFYDVQPDVQKQDSAKLFYIANSTFGMKSSTYGAEDVSAEQALPHLTHALDDLRRLGELDLRINHQ